MGIPRKIGSWLGSVCSLLVCLSGLASAQDPVGFGRKQPPRSITKTKKPMQYCVDFEEFVAGQVIGTSVLPLGPVEFSGFNPGLGNTNASIIFDSANPTGGDFDLGTPNQNFGGPGVGEGGAPWSPYPNSIPKGKILIIAENLVDGDNDGIIDEPDDADLVGSMVVADFVGTGPVQIESVFFIDGEEDRPPSTMEFFAPGGALIDTIQIIQPGNNGAIFVDLDVDNVERIVFNLNGSTAIDDICLREFIDCNENGINDWKDIRDGFSEDCNENGIPDECEPDCDGDGIPDNCEPDCDDDGTPDDCEPDCDNDGLPDDCEMDCDSDGTPDDCEPDCDSDGTPDDCEPDCDNDGTPDDCEPDCDSDGTPDDCEPDCDDDGLPDDCEDDCDDDGTPDDCEPDCNDDGTPDDCEPDCDGDGIPDECEPDCDMDGLPDDCEPDCDADGLPDDCEDDCDSDGLPDDCEDDCDNDGTPDDCEPDCDMDGTPDDCEPDCDNDGLPDDCEDDCDNDGTPDDCEPDCDNDGTPDDCEPDCDNDGTPDDCEMDCDSDGTPDDCEPDCDNDGTPDDCEPDCDTDGIPDDCEDDCDADGTPDDCEDDCDGDGIPDDCEPDCDDDGLPDDCEPDCDDDGTPDDCEPDCDNDGLPDDCEMDCDSDGLPDDCEDDCDSDGTPDDCEPDCDSDGTPDDCEPDCDSDGTPDDCEDDCDMDGTPDDCEPDCDSDGTPDDCEPDCDSDGTPDDCEDDSDGDGTPDDCEECPPPGHPCDLGCYELKDGGGNLSPPDYGLRLDNLFGPGSGNYTFSFEQPGTGGLLCYDPMTSTVTISGTGFGGLDIGGSHDPAMTSLVTVNFVYTGVYCTGTKVIAPESGDAFGTLVWEDTGEVFQLFGQANGDGQYGKLNSDNTWEGWISLSSTSNTSGTQDWILELWPSSDCPEPGDCDGDGIPDDMEADCDEDGIPDDCDDESPGICEVSDHTAVPDHPYDPGDTLGAYLYYCSGGRQPFSWAPGAQFIEHPDGTATLTGTLNSQEFAGSVDVSLTFSSRVDPGDPNYPPPGSPYLELFSDLPSHYFTTFGGPIDPLTWHYYEAAIGTATGSGVFAGFSATWKHDPGVDIAFQVGVGATGRHLGNGASGWFDVDVHSQPHDDNFCFRDNVDQFTELFLDLNCIPNCD